MKSSSVAWTAIIGFIIPWQTRYIVYAPEVGGVTWEFGVVSIFVSQVVIATWLCTRGSAWKIISWRTAVITFFCAIQLFVSVYRVGTVQMIISVLLLCGLMYEMYRHTELRIPFIIGFLVASVLHAMLACLQVLFGASFASTFLGIAAHRASDAGASVVIVDGVRYLRAYGGQSHPNIFGFQMVVALVALWQLTAARAMQMQRSTVTQLAVLFTGALALSFSRSALLALFMVGGALWWRWKQVAAMQRVVVTRAAITIGVMGVVLFPFFLQRVTVGNVLEQRSITQRVDATRVWGKIFFQHPWFGIGWGAYTAALPQEWTGDLRVPVHNAALLLLAELGIIGACAALATGWRFIKKIPTIMWAAVAAPFLFDHFLFSLWGGMALLAALMIVAWPIDDKSQISTK